MIEILILIQTIAIVIYVIVYIMEYRYKLRLMKNIAIDIIDIVGVEEIRNCCRVLQILCKQFQGLREY